MATTVLTHELDEATYQCRTALIKANEALRELFKLADYPTPTTLADVTRKSLIAFVGQRIEAVKNTPLYTAKERERIISDWTEWRVKAMPYIAAVERFVNDWRDVSPILNTATMNILTTDITEALTPRFTVEVPAQADEHIHLIAAVRRAIITLRDMEKKNDVKKMPLKVILNMTNDEINQSWANGTIRVDHTHDTASLIAWRKANNEAII